MKKIAFLSLLLFSSASAYAGDDASKSTSGQFTECIAVELWTMSGKALNKGKEPKKTVKIPEGWTVVGGGGGGGHPTVTICK